MVVTFIDVFWIVVLLALFLDRLYVLWRFRK